MATTKESHIDRTANEPRDTTLHTLLITSITQISPSIRIFTLTPDHPRCSISFRPGQWVDLYYPPFPPDQKPGGFTITSSPSSPSSLSSSTSVASNSVELAIKLPPPSSTPPSPPTLYLWRPSLTELLNTPVKVRIGGSFTFPPPTRALPSSSLLGPLKKVVFVAGGMGINPLMSMLSYLSEQDPLKEHLDAEVLYGVKDPGLPEKVGEVLFLDRIAALFSRPRGGLRGGVKLFVTGMGSQDGEVSCNGYNVPVVRRRIEMDDIRQVIGQDKNETAVYICGPPKMTDEFVEVLTSAQGQRMDAERVLYEKWW